MCKKLKFDHTTKWYKHKPESVLEVEAHEILWDFEIQTDHTIPARRLDLLIINKQQQKKRQNNPRPKTRTYHIVDFAVTTDQMKRGTST